MRLCGVTVSPQTNESLEKEQNNMKSKIIRLVTITFVMIMWGAAPVLADGGEPVPLCYPRPCLTK
jgi:hypothetical protein